MSVAVQSLQSRSSALWTIGFRPFFLAASLWSMAAPAVWVVLFVTGTALPSRFAPLDWHIHEMLFGFVLAPIAGFMLTAIPNWTGRSPIRGAPLAGLLLLWIIGRVACLLSALIPFWAAVAIDLAFPFVLCAVAAREIITARNWRNVAMPVPVGVLGIADLLMHLEAAGFDVPAGLGWRLGLTAVVVLVSVVGGRIIPAFTRNWLVKQRATHLPAAPDLLDRAGLGVLHVGMVGWAFFPAAGIVGVLLLVAAALTLWRLLRWRGGAARAEPLLAILHIGYFWLVVGTALLGAGMLTDAIPPGTAVHALTAGLIGTMVLAVMTRVSLGHTGRPLEADGATVIIYALVILAALARMAAPATGSAYLPLIEASAILWAAAFMLFAVKYGAMLLTPRLAVTAAREGGNC